MKIKKLFLKLALWTAVVLVIAYLGLTLFPVIPANSASTPFFQRWSNWDGTGYLRIAREGYGVLDADYAFFPFYPILIRAVSYLTFGNYLFSALLVSWLCLFFGLYFLYKLVRLDFDEEVAGKTIRYLLIFPFSFFFLAAYTESLFFLLVVASYYFFRKSSYANSSIFGLLLTATRVPGISILPALILEAIENKKTLKNKKIYLLALIPAGLLGFMVYLQIKKGDFLYFIHAHSVYFGRNQLTYPFKVLLSYVKNFFMHPGSVFASRDATIISLEFIFSVIFLALIVFVWLKIRKSYAVYAFIAWSLPLMTGRTGSMLRLVLILFPCFIALGFLGSRYEKFDRIYVLLSTLLLGLFVVSFVNGYWVA